VTSALYRGWVRHRRFSPREHEFRYRVFMPFLRLDELPSLFDGVPGWSARRPAPARFRREDFLGDPGLPLEEAVKRRVEEVAGERPDGPVYLLANLRYFGYLINPIACYYCFARDGETLRFLVAEVTNTPWNERHSYVLPAEPGSPLLRRSFDKQFHVSPFNPMDMRYHWRSNVPGERLVLHLENSCDNSKVFDATLSLQRESISAAALTGHLVRYPFMTAKVAAAIYWQALRLWLKGVPYHPHPKLKNSESTT
jgi:DUF1365 family protein